MKIDIRPIHKKIRQKNNEIKWLNMHPIDWITTNENKYHLNKKFKNKPYKMCSCMMCGNRRKYFGDTTYQEKKVA